MLEGLEITEVRYSEIETLNRLDSEFFQFKYIQAQNILTSLPHSTIGESYKVTDGEHGSVSFVNDGIKYLTAENIKYGYVDISKIRYVDKKVDIRNARARVNVGDILISIKGTLGEVAVAEAELLPANMNRDVAILKSNHSSSYHSVYLMLFLMSKYGALQSLRGGSGGVQQMITLERLRKFVYPTFSEVFIKGLFNIYQKSQVARNASKETYSEAEALLLSALNLTDYTPDFSNTNLKLFSESFGSSGRLDAEYYQPKFDELEQLIQSNGMYWKRISEIEEYNARGCQPEYYEDGKLNVINSKHILEDHLDYDNFEKTNEIFWTLQPKARVQTDDILVYTTGANIGRSNIYQSNEKALASNHVNILRLKEEDPFYVSFVINSFIGRMQTDKLSAGSAQAELYPKDISKFMIPFVEKSIQQEIRKNIIASLSLKRRSLDLLETAKRAVEIAIEKSENYALFHLEGKNIK